MLSYTNYTSRPLTRAVKQYYNENDEKPGTKAWLNRNVTCRIGYGAATVTTLFISLFDLLLGAGAIVGSAVTGRYFNRLNRAAVDMTEDGGKRLLAGTYKNFIRTLNPSASFKAEIEGIVHVPFVEKKIIVSINNLEPSQTARKRMTYFGAALLSIATRIADLVFGILSAIAAAFFGGDNKWLNKGAVEGLKAPLLLNDLYVRFAQTINPALNFNRA